MGQPVPPLQLVGETDESYVRRFIEWEARPLGARLLTPVVHLGAFAFAAGMLLLLVYR